MEDYAIIYTGGKQYRVSVGDEVFVEKLEGAAEDKVEFTEVVALRQGDDFRTGAPYLEGVSVKGEIVKQGRSKKVIVFKYKRKSGYKKTQGHRQPYTKVRITELA